MYLTEAEIVCPPPLTRTVAVPLPALGVVYKPLLLTLPAPATSDQVHVGWWASALPNWSDALTVNCCFWPSLRDAVPGVRVT